LFADICNLCSYLKASDHVSHPFKTKLLFCILQYAVF
jgi:hypothetical protein